MISSLFGTVASCVCKPVTVPARWFSDKVVTCMVDKTLDSIVNPNTLKQITQKLKDKLAAKRRKNPQQQNDPTKISVLYGPLTVFRDVVTHTRATAGNRRDLDIIQAIIDLMRQDMETKTVSLRQAVNNVQGLCQRQLEFDREGNIPSTWHKTFSSIFPTSESRPPLLLPEASKAIFSRLILIRLAELTTSNNQQLDLKDEIRRLVEYHTNSRKPLKHILERAKEVINIAEAMSDEANQQFRNDLLSLLASTAQEANREHLRAVVIRKAHRALANTRFSWFTNKAVAMALPAKLFHTVTTRLITKLSDDESLVKLAQEMRGVCENATILLKNAETPGRIPEKDLMQLFTPRSVSVITDFFIECTIPKIALMQICRSLRQATWRNLTTGNVVTTWLIRVPGLVPMSLLVSIEVCTGITQGIINFIFEKIIVKPIARTVAQLIFKRKIKQVFTTTVESGCNPNPVHDLIKHTYIHLIKSLLPQLEEDVTHTQVEYGGGNRQRRPVPIDNEETVRLQNRQRPVSCWVVPAFSGTAVAAMELFVQFSKSFKTTGPIINLVLPQTTDFLCGATVSTKINTFVSSSLTKHNLESTADGLVQELTRTLEQDDRLPDNDTSLATPKLENMEDIEKLRVSAATLLKQKVWPEESTLLESEVVNLFTELFRNAELMVEHGAIPTQLALQALGVMCV